jgi:hypothetical protein
VNETWSFQWTFATSFSVGRVCNGTRIPTSSYAFLTCQATATADFDAAVSLLDRTNGTSWREAPRNFGAINLSGVIYNTACVSTCRSLVSTLGPSGTYNGSANATFGLWVPNLNASHRYALVANVTGQVLVIVKTNSSGFTKVVRLLGTARARLDMARGGNGASFGGVTVT